MKRSTLIIGISVAIGIGLSFLYVQIITLPDKNPSQKEQDTITYDPDLAPPKSLQGSIIYMDGDVKWQSRTATESAKLDASTSIQQGELIETGDNGATTILFGEGTLIDIFHKSSVAFTQTLPANIVITHQRGKAEYSQETLATPLSIRAGHLLVTLHKGVASITLKETKNTDSQVKESIVTVKVIQGSATAVYNSLNYKTKYRELDEGEVLFYNDISRESEIY